LVVSGANFPSLSSVDLDIIDPYGTPLIGSSSFSFVRKVMGEALNTPAFSDARSAKVVEEILRARGILATLEL
jgi:hypothetical protein